MSAWSKRLVNLHQGTEQRRAKYAVLKEYGLSASWARAIRDWPYAKIDRFLEANGYVARGQHES